MVYVWSQQGMVPRASVGACACTSNTSTHVPVCMCKHSGLSPGGREFNTSKFYCIHFHLGGNKTICYPSCSTQGGKKKWASLQSLQQAFLPSSPAPLPLSSTVRGTVTPQATVLLPAFKALCLPVWCSLGFLGVFFFPMKEGRHITGKDGSQKTCIHGQGKSPSTESLALTTHLQHAHLHPNMTRYRHISQSVLFNMWNSAHLYWNREELICSSVHVYVCVRIQMGSSGLLQTLSDSGLTRALAFGSNICVIVEQPKHSNKPIKCMQNMYLSLHADTFTY